MHAISEYRVTCYKTKKMVSREVVSWSGMEANKEPYLNTLHCKFFVVGCTIFVSRRMHKVQLTVRMENYATLFAFSLTDIISRYVHWTPGLERFDFESIQIVDTAHQNTVFLSLLSTNSWNFVSHDSNVLISAVARTCK